MRFHVDAVQTLIYAGQIMEDDRQLQEYKVPKVIHCHCIMIHKAESALAQSGACSVYSCAR